MAKQSHWRRQTMDALIEGGPHGKIWVASEDACKEVRVELEILCSISLVSSVFLLYSWLQTYKVAVTYFLSSLICITGLHIIKIMLRRKWEIGCDIEISHWASLIAMVKFPAVLTILDKPASVFVLPTSFYWKQATHTGMYPNIQAPTQIQSC